jgi:GNAT superfamily N-acetyltransferase
MQIDLLLLERWLRGWSLARGLPLPELRGGGLVVDVGWPEQRRRHVFVDAGAALRQCARETSEPGVFLKAAVEPEVMRSALGRGWHVAAPGYLMRGPVSMAALPALPDGYSAGLSREHGARVVTVVARDGGVAASGRLVMDQGCAIFDRIETHETHRRQGLARALMGMLDALARDACVSERLLVATGAGRALYLSLGWQVLAPYSTAVRP